MMYQKIVILSIIFFAIPMYSMELSISSSCNMVSLPQDIIREKIQSLMSLQDISRLKRISLEYNILCNTDLICPLFHQGECSIACKRLALEENYFACTKALGHLACNARNKKLDRFVRDRNEEMFKHLWNHQAVERDKHMKSMCQGSDFTLKDQMKMYKPFYKVKYAHKAIVSHAVEAIYNSDAACAKKVLAGDKVSIFDVIHKYVGVKRLFCDTGELDIIFYQICQFGDAELIKAFCGGVIDERSFEYIVPRVGAELIIDLILKGILPVDIVNTSNNKTVLHVAARRGFQGVIKTALDSSKCSLNYRDAQGKTPLHYAVQHGQVGVVLTILSNDEVNIHVKDKYRQKPIDYTTSIKRFFVPHNADELTSKQTIREMLEIHAEKRDKHPRSYSKVNHNGYDTI